MRNIATDVIADGVNANMLFPSRENNYRKNGGKYRNALNTVYSIAERLKLY